MATLAVGVTPAHAAWPQTWTIFVDNAGLRDVETVSHIVDGGDYFFVGEFHDAGRASST